MAIAEYGNLDALGLAELVGRGAVTPAELLEEAIARSERINPRVAAVITPVYEEARRAAAAPPTGGPFAGVPFLVKDITVTWRASAAPPAAATWPTTWRCATRRSRSGFAARG